MDNPHTSMPERIWARIRGGGVSLPSGKSYVTVVGEDRETEKATEYVRADLFHEALDLAEQLNSPLEARDQHFLREPASEKIAELRRLAGENNG